MMFTRRKLFQKFGIFRFDYGCLPMGENGAYFKNALGLDIAPAGAASHCTQFVFFFLGVSFKH